MEYKEKVLKKFAEAVKTLYELCFETENETQVWDSWNEIKFIADDLKYLRNQEIIIEEDEK